MVFDKERFSISNTASKKGWFIIVTSFVRLLSNFGKGVILTQELPRPDLNVMDFAIWGILARKACEKPHSNVESLKRSLKKAWADLDEETIRNCCANAHKRLEAVVEAEGRYIGKK